GFGDRVDLEIESVGEAASIEILDPERIRARSQGTGKAGRPARRNSGKLQNVMADIGRAVMPPSQQTRGRLRIRRKRDLRPGLDPKEGQSSARERLRQHSD